MNDQSHQSVTKESSVHYCCHSYSAFLVYDTM